MTMAKQDSNQVAFEISAKLHLKSFAFEFKIAKSWVVTLLVVSLQLASVVLRMAVHSH